MLPYPVGTPGQRWGAAELALWRSRQERHRSHADDVLVPIDRLRSRYVVSAYGELAYADQRFPLVAVRSRVWRKGLPAVLVTGGVHGYETSGVHGAIRFLDQHAAAYEGKANLLVVPCASPWAYERVQRWNFDAIDPNRSFRTPSPAEESAALMRLVRPLIGQFSAHIDLHETTNTDETEFRPAKAARDGEPFQPCTIPDGFYLVDDAQNPQPAFQQAIIDAVRPITPIAQADERGELIGSPMVAPGVIRYELRALGLCGGLTGARCTSTTEVYPDSPRTSPGECIAAQVAAVCAAIDWVLAEPQSAVSQ
jgi:hypothetical protein